MSQEIDARGLSCPQPVILTLEALKKMSGGQLEVLVDTDTSVENVSRAATSQGWRVEAVSQEADCYRLRLMKG